MKKLLWILCTIMTMSVNQAHAEIITKMISYQDGAIELEGVMVFDPDIKEKRAGILVIHEWWGRTEYAIRRAKEYAALGYVAFAADMYGKGITADDPEQAGKLSNPFYKDRALFRTRAAAGLSVLANDLHVDPTRLAALGYCFGGTGALELARSGADLRGAIVFHGGLASTNSADAKNIKGAVLALIGADDPFIPVADRESFKAEMKAANARLEYVEYPGAQHAFTNSSVEEKNINGAAYNKHADEDSFLKSKVFLASVLQLHIPSRVSNRENWIMPPPD